MLYKHPSIQEVFTIVITEIILLEEMPAELANSTDLIVDYLNDFCEWDQEEKLRRETEWDFGILLSGKDLRFGQHRTTSGMRSRIKIMGHLSIFKYFIDYL